MSRLFFLYVIKAVPTGFEPAISALTGPRVKPATLRDRAAEVYHTQDLASSEMTFSVLLFREIDTI